MPLKRSQGSFIIQSIHTYTAVSLYSVYSVTLYGVHIVIIQYYTLLHSVTIQCHYMEVISVEVTINNLNFVICLTYRPPTTYTEQYDTLLLSYLRSFDDSTDLLIVGDLNLPDVDWNTYSGCTTISNAHAEMIHKLFDLNLMQLIDNPTHVTGNILDVILTNTDYCQNIVTHPILCHLAFLQITI